MNKSMIILMLVTFSFSATSLVSMESSKPSAFPTLKDFCYANIIDWPRDTSKPIDTSPLPQELGEELIEVYQTIGSSVTEIIENNIARRAPDSFLLALCLRNKDNKLAQRLMMQILNKYPENLMKDLEQTFEDYLLSGESRRSCFRSKEDFKTYLDTFSQVINHSAPYSDSVSTHCVNLLSVCITCGNEVVTRYLINKFKININSLTDVSSRFIDPLRKAAQKNNLILAKSALDLGENVDKGEFYPLYHAVSLTYPKMVTLLLSYGSTESERELIRMFNGRSKLNEPRKNILQQLCKKISPDKKYSLILKLQNNINKGSEGKNEEWINALQEALNSRDE